MKRKLLLFFALLGLFLPLRAQAKLSISGLSVDSINLNDQKSAAIRFALNEPADEATAVVYNSEGAQVAKMRIANPAQGQNEAIWRLTNQDGYIVKSGQYFAVVEAVSSRQYSTWTRIDRKNGQTDLNTPGRIAVNRNPGSASFGRVCVVNGDMRGDRQKGVYLYGPDLSFLGGSPISAFASGNPAAQWKSSGHSPSVAAFAGDFLLAGDSITDGAGLLIGDAAFSAVSFSGNGPLPALNAEIYSGFDRLIDAHAWMSGGDIRLFALEDRKGLAVVNYLSLQMESGRPSGEVKSKKIVSQYQLRPQLSSPAAITADESGVLYLLDGSRGEEDLYAIGPDKKIAWTASTSAGGGAGGLAAFTRPDGSTLLAVAKKGAATVLFFNGDGSPAEPDRLPADIPGEKSVAFDPVGNLYVSSRDKGLLLYFAAPGAAGNASSNGRAAFEISDDPTPAPQFAVESIGIRVEKNGAAYADLNDFLPNAGNFAWEAGPGDHVNAAVDAASSRLAGAAPPRWVGTDSIELTAIAPNFRRTSIRAQIEVAGDPEIYVGPYLQNVSKTSVVVRWEADVRAPSLVRYREAGGPDWKTAAISETTLMHEVPIEGLEPYTRYEYQAVSGAAESETAHFRTAPKSVEPFKFEVWGDNRTNPEAHRRVADGMAARNPDFAINVGDIVTDGKYYEQFKREYFDPIYRLGLNAPTWISIGNHEGDSPWFYDYVTQPGNEGWFSFQYGNAHFIILDTNKPYDVGSEQRQWLEGDLASDPSRRSTWNFAFFHHPPWSEGWDSPGYDGEHGMRENLVPLFAKYGVDMVFNGHTHDYERGHLNGVNYVISGGVGSALDHWLQDFDHITVYKSAYQFCEIEVDRNRLRMTARYPDGEIFDQLILEK